MSSVKPKILNERVEKCPYCGKEALHVIEALHEIPHFGPILLVTLKCSNCGYKHTSVSHVEQHAPLRIKIYVNSLEDLNIKIIRSPTATIRIPELGITIEPGPISQGEITTIEGYLLRVHEILKSLFNNKSHKDVIDKIEDTINGKVSFTFIIEDPFGNSAVIVQNRKKIKKETIPAEELKYIKYGDTVLEMKRGGTYGSKKKV